MPQKKKATKIVIANRAAYNLPTIYLIDEETDAYAVNMACVKTYIDESYLALITDQMSI